MHARLLVSLAVSGAVHAGFFVVGEGLSDRLVAGLQGTERTPALEVAVRIEATVNRAEQSPPVARPSPDAHDTHTRVAPREPTPEPQRPSIDQARVQRDAAPGDTADAGQFAPAPPTRDDDVPEVQNQGVEEEAAPSARSRTRQQTAAAAPRAARLSPAPGRLDEATRENAERTYLAEFLAELSKHRHYPRSARLRQQQGRVVVALVLRRDGTINDVRVAEPSQFATLNRAALRSVRRLDRFRPFPDALDQERLQLNVPFQYAIE